MGVEETPDLCHLELCHVSQFALDVMISLHLRKLGQKR